MRDLPDELAAAAGRVNPAWNAAREHALRQRVERGLEVRRRARAASLLGTGALLIVAFGFGLGRVLAPAPVSVAPPMAAARSLLALEDGSSVMSVSGDARITPVEVTPRATLIRLESGTARFDVARREGRRFRVMARDTLVTVLGTAFEVSLEPEAVHVRVERGRVEVSCAGAREELDAGESVRCRTTSVSAPGASVGTPAAAVARDDEAPLGPPGTSSPRSAKTAPTWRTLAQDGDYRAAFARMAAEGPGAVRDEPGDLLFAADVARLSGHPEVAIARLERVVRAHASDSRAPLAAFTLGRTLLDALGRPREAAEAFAAARRLAPGGALAQDALAREVESWSRAGEARLARDRAREYLEQHPDGRRAKAVRYHGGVE